jgi:hypothetical protein
VLLGLLAWALVDSINPSAIVVTLYLLSRESVPSQVVVYVAAIFLTYLTLGAMMMSGIDALLPSLRTVGSGRLGLVVEGLIGLALLLYAIRTPSTSTSAPQVEPSGSTYAATASSGGGWTRGTRPSGRDCRRAPAGRCSGSPVSWAARCSPGASWS